MLLSYNHGHKPESLLKQVVAEGYRFQGKSAAGYQRPFTNQIPRAAHRQLSS